MSTASPSRRTRRTLVLVIVGVIVVIGLIAAVTIASLNASRAEDARAAAREAASIAAERDDALSMFGDATAECGLANDRQRVFIDNDGLSLAIVHSYDGTDGTVSTDQLECLLDELEVPDSIGSALFATTASDSRESDDYEIDAGMIDVSWWNEPDEGVDCVWTLTLTDELMAGWTESGGSNDR